MNQGGDLALEPIILGAADVPFVEAAARDLEDLAWSGATLTPGHWPSWGVPVPDGLALCVSCWRLIAAWQLGAERCPGAEQSGLA